MNASNKPTKQLTQRWSMYDETDLTSRLPDYGPLDIQDYKTFMKLSRTMFYDKWKRPQILFHTVSLNDFDIHQLLGSGSSSYVTLSKHKASKKLYALKCVLKKKIIQNHHVENLKTEQLLLGCTNHPFTIYLHYTFKDNSYIYFVLPFIEGRDLLGHLQELGRCKEDQAQFYASQITLALEYLHQIDFVHRDLKPENILIDHTGYLKLSDFGFAKHLRSRLRTYTTCGTPEYMAPEIILHKGYSKAVDWWSFGVFIYEIVSGETPFGGDSVESIHEKVLSTKYKTPNYFSCDLRDLLDNLLQINLSRRYGNLKNGVNDIKEHDWLRTINWLAILNRKAEAAYKPNRHMIKFQENTDFKLPRAAKEIKYLEEFADF